MLPLKILQFLLGNFQAGLCALERGRKARGSNRGGVSVCARAVLQQNGAPEERQGQLANSSTAKECEHDLSRPPGSTLMAL